MQRTCAGDLSVDTGRLFVTVAAEAEGRLEESGV